jgi:ABC-type multidrug transport system permease subunit
LQYLTYGFLVVQAFVEDMKVYIRERLNGYYLPVTFTIANTLASLPFIFLISVVSTVCVYFIAGLSSSGGDVIYFILALFASLTVVESLMMAIAPVRMLLCLSFPNLLVLKAVAQ